MDKIENIEDIKKLKSNRVEAMVENFKENPDELVAFLNSFFDITIRNSDSSAFKKD